MDLRVFQFVEHETMQSRSKGPHLEPPRRTSPGKAKTIKSGGLLSWI